MIRRYAAALRVTLAAAEMALALIVVGGATNLWYGRTSGWPPDVEAPLPATNLAIAVFVGMWIGVLWLQEMKPGMTGLWQVGARQDPEFDRWVQRDLEYIDNWSLWLDFKIVARTLPAVLSGTGR